MSTVDDAVEAGARALSESEYGEGPHDSRLADLAVTAAWPILSAPLRELVEWLNDDQDAGALEEVLDRIDKELGND